MQSWIADVRTDDLAQDTLNLVLDPSATMEVARHG
jgi:hypothetical protein